MYHVCSLCYFCMLQLIMINVHVTKFSQFQIRFWRMTKWSHNISVFIDCILALIKKKHTGACPNHNAKSKAKPLKTVHLIIIYQTQKYWSLSKSQSPEQSKIFETVKLTLNKWTSNTELIFKSGCFILLYQRVHEVYINNIKQTLEQHLVIF